MRVGVWIVPAIAETLILTSRSFGATPPPTPCSPDLGGAPAFKKLKKREDEGEKWKRLRILKKDENNGEQKSILNDTKMSEDEKKKINNRKKIKTWIDDF